METIEIQAVADIVTSKGGREYFTFEDNTQKRYVCFIPKLNHFIQVGSSIDADITPGKTPQDSPRLDMIYVNGKPVVSVEKKTAGRSYGKSKEELAQQRQLAEAQNRSIQAQTALNRAVDLAVANKIPLEGAVGSVAFLKGIKGTAQEFYQLLQSLTLISEAKVIHQKVKEAKGEATKPRKLDETATTQEYKGEGSGPSSGETLELLPEETERVKGFLEELMKHGIEAPRTFLEVEYAIPQGGPLSDAQCEALYKTIKTKMKW